MSGSITSLPNANLPLSDSDHFLVDQAGGTRKVAWSDLEAIHNPLNTNTSWVMQWGGGAVVFNGVYYYTLYAPYNGTITALDWLASGGNFNATIAIQGTPVTGLNNLTINSNGQSTTNATATNTFTIGQPITLTITNVITAILNTVLSLRITKSL